MRILVPFGTRPEIIKLASVVAALRRSGHEVTTLATGQQYDAALTDAFFGDLGMDPDERWELPSDEAERVGALLTNAYRVVWRQRPDLVLLLGDTYTVPFFCIAARRHRVPVAHLEAGIRSFNQTSMEETNRKVAAVTASLQFPPTELAASFLRAEGVPEERIRVVGNSVIDLLRSKGLAARPVAERRGVLLTAHRATTVDDPERLAMLVSLILRLAEEIGPVTFPVHPRTRSGLTGSGLLEQLRVPGVELLEPLPYGDLLAALAASVVVVTDSGGIQEEAAYLGIPVVVLRSSTPRWEGVAAGISTLVGLDGDRAIEAARRFSEPEEQERIAATPCPYGEGDTGERVARVLAEPGTAELLRIEEPDLTSWRPEDLVSRVLVRGS